MKKTILFCILIFTGMILCLHPAEAVKKQKPVELEIKSYDGFKIVGTLDIPRYATVINKAPLVIFLHSIWKSQVAWGDFPKETKINLNVATLNLDLRGHGKSVINRHGKRTYWRNLTLEDFQKMPEDVIEVLKYLKKEYPEIDSDNVAIVGASLGATVGLMTASYQDEKKQGIKTVIMLSPMLEYKGFDLRLPIVKYGKHPLLLIVSEKDKYPYESAQELIKFGQGEKLLKVYPFGGHGEDLLKFQRDSVILVLKWLKDSLPKEKTEAKHEKYTNYIYSGDFKFKYREVGEYTGKIKVR